MNNIEYKLASRTAQSDRSSRSSVMMLIATISVALGLAVMVVTLAVVDGFRRDLYADFRGFAADVRVSHITSLTDESAAPLPFSGDFLAEVRAMDEVEWAAPYAEAVVMVRAGDNSLGLKLKGLSADYPLEWWQSRLTQGRMPDVGAAERGREVALSRSTAQRLGVGVGDKLEVLSVEDGQRPRRNSFRVVGLYHTGLEEMDSQIAPADVRDVRSALGWSADEVSGYDIMLKESERSTEVANQIDGRIVDGQWAEDMTNYLPATLQLRYPIVFDWLKAHTVIARSVVIIMMVVLLFNMAAAVLIMVFDRIGMIGMLKALGMRTSSIRRIFLYRSALLFARGAAWGNAVGLLLVGVQALWEIVRLDPSGYMLSTLPVSIGWWIVWLNVGVMAVAVGVMVLPSMAVARIAPEESLKYKL